MKRERGGGSGIDKCFIMYVNKSVSQSATLSSFIYSYVRLVDVDHTLRMSVASISVKQVIMICVGMQMKETFLISLLMSRGRGRGQYC